MDEYFRWRADDAHRNALSAHCYWQLRASSTTQRLSGATASEQNELFSEYGVNFNDLPSWQKRGRGLWWETFEREGLDPRTDTSTVTTRRRIHIEHELPIGEAFGDLIRGYC